MAILRDEGCGADCSSLAELVICRRLGHYGDVVMFTSNNTTASEFAAGRELGAIINLDHPNLIDTLVAATGMPEMISLPLQPRPGAERQRHHRQAGGSEVRLHPRADSRTATAACKELASSDSACTRWSSRTSCTCESFFETARMLFELAVLVRPRDRHPDRVHQPRRRHRHSVSADAAAKSTCPRRRGVRRSCTRKFSSPAGLTPMRLCMENGRVITGPYGYLVTRVLNHRRRPTRSTSASTPAWRT